MNTVTMSCLDRSRQLNVVVAGSHRAHNANVIQKKLEDWGKLCWTHNQIKNTSCSKRIHNIDLNFDNYLCLISFSYEHKHYPV